MMNPLFLLIASAFLASKLVFAFDVQLSIEEPPPYVIGVKYNVTWITERGPGEKAEEFFIVKERPLDTNDDNVLSGDAQFVDAAHALTSIGTVQIQFYEPTQYNIVAYHSQKSDQTGYEGAFGRLENIQVGPNPTATSAPSSYTTGGAVATESPVVSVFSPEPSSNSTTSGNADNINKSSISRANHTAVIVGSVLGTSIGISILIFLLYIFLVAPRLRKREYASQLGIFIKASPSPTTSLGEKGDLESGLVDTFKLAPPPPGLKANKDRQFSFFSDSTTTSSLPSIFTDATPPVRFVPLTDRQMELQDRIHNLKAQLISLKGDTDEFEDLMKRINVLEHLHNSDWALDKTDEIPPGLV